MHRTKDRKQGCRISSTMRVHHNKAQVLKNYLNNSYFNGLCHFETRDVDKAKKSIQRAIAENNDEALYYVSYGEILHHEGNFTQAIYNYRYALKLQPDLLPALFNLGNTLREVGDNQGAITCYKRSIQIDSKIPQIHNNLGIAYHNQKRLNMAISCFKNAISIDSSYLEALNNLGNVYRELKAYDSAIEQYKKALKVEPENPSVNYNVGILYQKQRQLGKAEDYYLKAVHCEPPIADAHHNLGKLYQDQNQLENALFHYNKVLELQPEHFDARFNRSLALLASGDFEKGWKEYEWRFRRDRWKRIYPHRLKGPRWDGKPFPGKTLFVPSEQGFGDIIWLSRYLPLVKALGGFVIFETRKELLELFKDFPGVDRLVPMSFDHPPEFSYDYFIPLMSLPLVLKTTVDTIPKSVPYIHASPEKKRYWKPICQGSKLKIGVVWAASKTYEHEKSCDVNQIYSLLCSKNFDIFGLQKNEEASLTRFGGIEIINLGPLFKDFADTAGAVSNLDLIISVDTAVAHLAGAMGKPVWVLLPYAADWRWFLHRDDSPWYPTMRLFRQHQAGDWSRVIKEIVTDLKKIKISGRCTSGNTTRSS